MAFTDTFHRAKVTFLKDMLPETRRSGHKLTPFYAYPTPDASSEFALQTGKQPI